MEAGGSILRGNFTGTAKGNEPDTAEWCDRRLLARIHHLTIATLRKQVEPVTAAQFMRWLLRWQHVAPQSQLSGERGLLEAVRQLQGFEIPANAWERQILSSRMNKYDPAELDQLCLTGAVGWGRLSPHPATLEDSGEGRRRVVPTSVAPITLLRARRFGLDAAPGWPKRSRAMSVSSAIMRAPCLSSCAVAGHRSLLTSCVAQTSSRPRSRPRCGSWWLLAWLPPTASTICAR